MCVDETNRPTIHCRAKINQWILICFNTSSKEKNQAKVFEIEIHSSLFPCESNGEARIRVTETLSCRKNIWHLIMQIGMFISSMMDRCIFITSYAKLFFVNLSLTTVGKLSCRRHHNFWECCARRNVS